MQMRSYLRLIRFDKPIGTLLLLWPTLWALFIAAHGIPPLYTLIVFPLGVLLTRSAGCAINDCADAKIDRCVTRTRSRPLVLGELSRRQALFACFILSVLAFILAVCFLKPLTIVLSIPALLLFISYPFTKRFFPLPQLYLGVAYSFGILMGFMEILGTINLEAVLLFLANLFWVFGYDTIYALVDKKDDLKIGIKTSAITLDNGVPAVVALSYAMFTLLLAVIGHMSGFGVLYWIGLVMGAALLCIQVMVLVKQIEGLYFKMFLLNNHVGFVVFIGLLLSLFHAYHI